MKLGIMQPYFLPYIGYFQLVRAVDVFVVYDNIKYTKKGWINRNRFLRNGTDAVFSLPIKSGSDSLDIVQRELADAFEPEKLLNQIRGAYARAPQFPAVFPLVEEIILHPDSNLFGYVFNSLRKVCSYLEIDTQLIVSSDVAIDHELRAQEKVIAICKACDAETYVNPPGGMELYSRAAFGREGIDLQFIVPGRASYAQFDHEFVANLSILDVLMFNRPEEVRSRLLPDFELH